MTSDGGAWALPEADPGPGQDAAAPAGLPAAGAAAAGPRGRPGILLWLASGLFTAAASTRACSLFTHIGGNPAQYEFASQLAKECYAIVLALACAILLLMRRTRLWAQGAACAFGSLYIARDFGALRPSFLDASSGRRTDLFLAASVVLETAAGAVVLVRIVREGRRPRDRQTRVDRATALIGGLTGAVLWFIAGTLPAIRLRQETSSGVTAAAECCGWSQVSGWTKAYTITTGIVVLVLACLAATGRSRARSFGLLLGTALVLTGSAVEMTVQIAAPLASAFGMNRVDAVTRAGLGFTVGPVSGFWLAIAGIAVLAAVAVLRLALAPRRAAFPEARPRPRLG